MDHDPDYRMAVIPFIFVTGFLLGTVFLQPDDEKRKEQEIDREVVEIVLTNRNVEPYRPTLQKEESLKFVNRGNYTFNMSFEKEIEGFVLEPGEEKVVDIDSMTYYIADPLNGARDLEASIYMK